MHIIDQYAYNNRLRRIDPAHKAGVALTILSLCLVFNEAPVSLLAIGWVFFLTVGLAGIPARAFGRVLLGEATFLILATVGVALSLSFEAPANPEARMLPLGPVWLSLTPDSLSLAAGLVLRALGAASAMNFLALTTPLTDIVELLRRWRIPIILIDLMVVIYRFIFVLLESLHRMYIAQESRLGYHAAYFRAMNSAALLGSRLFMEAFRRSRRLEIALESRGYDGGDLRVLPATYTSDRRVIRNGLAGAAGMFLVWLIL